MRPHGWRQEIFLKIFEIVPISLPILNEIFRTNIVKNGLGAASVFVIRYPKPFLTVERQPVNDVSNAKPRNLPFGYLGHAFSPFGVPAQPPCAAPLLRRANPSRSTSCRRVRPRALARSR